MTTTILEYSKTEAALTMLREKFSIVPDVSTNEGYVKCKSNAKEVGQYRIDLEKKRKEIKGPALEQCKAIDTEAKRITGELAEIENPLKLAYKEIDDKKKLAKEEYERAIQEKIEGIAVFIDMARDGVNSEDIAEWIEQVSDIDCADGFGKFTKEALVQKNKTLESLQNYMESAINREIEDKRLKEERKKLEKEKAEQEEKETARLLIQIENDHEFGLMMNEKFNIDKDERLMIEDRERKELIAFEQVEKEKREKQIAEDAAKKAEEEKKQAIIDKEVAEKSAVQQKIDDAETAKKLKIENDEKARLLAIRTKEHGELVAENARLAEVKRQEEAEKAEKERIAKIESNRKHVSSIRREIKEQIMEDAGIDEETTIKVVKSILKMVKSGRIKINYE